MRIAGFQIKIPFYLDNKGKCEFLESLCNRIEKFYYQNKFDVLILPELSIIDYHKDVFSRLHDLAEAPRGYSFDVFSQLARKLNIYIVYGLPTVQQGDYYISQVVVSPKGEYVSHYDKIHIAQFGVSIEKDYFKRGNRICTFSIEEWVFGIIICYDFRFSLLFHEMCFNRDVDFIIHPVAFYKDDTFPSWHSFVVSRALEFQVYYMSINRAGKQYGQTIFCPPWVNDAEKPGILDDNEDLLVVEPQKEVLENVRKIYSFRKDILADYHLL